MLRQLEHLSSDCQHRVLAGLFTKGLRYKPVLFCTIHSTI